MTPAGWYQDPHGAPGVLRWWDGQQWTENTRSGEQQASWSWGSAEQVWTQPEQDAPASQPSGSPAFGRAETAAFDPEAASNPPGAASYGQPEAPPYGQPGTAPYPPGAAPYGQPGATPDPPGGTAYRQPGYAPYPSGAPGRSGRGPRTSLLVGGGIVVVAVIVVIVLVATGVFGGSDRSPVTGTITDTGAGISYAKLGGTWHVESLSPSGGLAKLGFHQGESAHVMENYENGQPYLATAYSGSLASLAGSLENTARTVLAGLEPNAYPEHTRQELQSESHRVDGHDGWLLKVKFTFPQAESRGWNFRSETAVVIIISRGAGASPAEYYVSIPDSHKKRDDLDLLISSLKVS